MSARRTRDDLLAAFRRVNGRYFAGKLELAVRWGSQARRSKRGGLVRRKLYAGSYNPNGPTVTINRVLRESWVPRYVVEAVLYHEMLHHCRPGLECSDEEFVALESRHADYERSERWLARNEARARRW